MLVLSRKKNQSIIIGQDIEISILGVEGDSVKIGINAPKKVSVLRKELLDEVAETNKEAMNMANNAGIVDDIKSFTLKEKEK